MKQQQDNKRGEIGESLKFFREAQCVSEVELAKKAGIPLQTITELENGSIGCSSEELIQYAAAYMQALGTKIVLKDGQEDEEVQDAQYSLVPSDSKPNHWVCTDLTNGIVCVFESRKFNDTQTVTRLEDVNITALQLAAASRDMADWLRANHPEKMF
jgi:transcriptional regulator with XRE-family HTH domain